MILKKDISKIYSARKDLDRNIAIDMVSDNLLWIIDENGNAGVLEVERKAKKTIVRGRDINTYVCFMRGLPLTKTNIKKAIAIMDEWNNKDRSNEWEYPTGWRNECLAEIG